MCNFYIGLYQANDDEEYVPSQFSENSDTSRDSSPNVNPYLSKNNKNKQNSTNTDSKCESSISDTHNTPRNTRKRAKRESEWANTKRKRLRTQGKEYISNKKVRQGKTLKIYNHVCHYKCNKNISEAERKELFHEYYKLPSYDRQTAFLSSCITKVDTKKRKVF